jgi:hypothetical protein
MLDRQPQFQDDRIAGVGAGNRGEYLKVGYWVDSNDENILVRKADRIANIIYSRKIMLTIGEWNDFENLISKSKFWDIPVTSEERGFDGAEWIIEARFQNKYRFVNRWSPRDTFKELGLFLIKLSGLKEEIY